MSNSSIIAYRQEDQMPWAEAGLSWNLPAMNTMFSELSWDTLRSWPVLENTSQNTYYIEVSRYLSLLKLQSRCIILETIYPTWTLVEGHRDSLVELLHSYVELYNNPPINTKG